MMAPPRPVLRLVPMLLCVAACDRIPQRSETAGEKASAPDGVVEGRGPVRVLPGTGGERTGGDLKAYIVEARASSSDGRRAVPELAFDGNPKTRWSSAWKDNEWLEAHFDRPVAVEKVVIQWEAARAAAFDLSLLNSQSEWIRVGRAENARGPSDTIPFASAVQTRGLRIDCRRRATEWGNSILEVEVYGKAEGPPPANSLLGFEIPPDEWELRERGIAERLLAGAAADPPTAAGLSDEQFLELVSRRAFDYFWWESHPETGLTKDRARNFESSEEVRIASVAAVGYALTACSIGAGRNWIPREEALDRVLLTLRTFSEGRVRHVRGFLPHFVDLLSGTDLPGTEISTIDTALFLSGAIVAKEYFRHPQVDALVNELFERVDWQWARHHDTHFVSHGLDPSGHFLATHWGSMTEGLLIYLLAMGSATYPLPAESWYAIDRTFGEEGGYRFLVESTFQTLFPYQYPALWYDFRGRTDRKGVDYFQNATRAALAMRAHCIREAANFPRSYGPDLWGLSPSDGPGNRYLIYGFPPGRPQAPPDGTLSIHAIGGAMPFIPRHAIRALRRIYDEHHVAWGKYGFSDAVNPTLDFVTRDAVGLDTGTVLIGIENHRSGFVWDMFMRSPWVRQADNKIGWEQRRRTVDPGGPVDLARQATWKFSTGGGDLSAWNLDDTTWRDAPVPDHWENLGPPFAHYDGAAWYRATFGLDADRIQAWAYSGGPVYLSLGGVDDNDVAYVNGVRVGETRAATESLKVRRRYPVPLTALHRGRNVVSLHVVDTGGTGGLWLGPVELGPDW